MNLLELKRLVDQAVEIAYEPESVTVRISTFKTGTAGHLPCTDLKSAYLGIDWEANSFLLQPVTTLREIDRDEIALLRKQYEELGWSLYKIGKIKRENEQLKAKVKELTGK